MNRTNGKTMTADQIANACEAEAKKLLSVAEILRGGKPTKKRKRTKK